MSEFRGLRREIPKYELVGKFQIQQVPRICISNELPDEAAVAAPGKIVTILHSQ